ncbi:hypothetical protein ACLBR5_29015 [Escherichia coli]
MITAIPIARARRLMGKVGVVQKIAIALNDPVEGVNDPQHLDHICDQLPKPVTNLRQRTNKEGRCDAFVRLAAI